ncbi:hypothetical protein CHS0354_021038, partial [Potamilus streckersoni]
YIILYYIILYYIILYYIILYYIILYYHRIFEYAEGQHRIYGIINNKELHQLLQLIFALSLTLWHSLAYVFFYTLLSPVCCGQ